MAELAGSATWTRREVSTPGGEFIVREGGAGSPAVLYLHDEISVGPDGVADRLSEGHRVIAPIHPGFGDASRPEWVERVRDVVEHYIELLEALDLGDDLVIVGSSMGGWIAAELALRLDNRVRGLVLLNPVGLQVKGHSAADFWFVRNRDEVLFSSRAVQPEVEVEEMVANEESAARYGWTPRLYDPTLGPRIHRLSVPTLLVWAGADRLLPREHLAVWRDAIPSAEVVEVAGSGHFTNHEQPAEVVAGIARFIEQAATKAEAK